MGIVRKAPLFRQPLYATLCETLCDTLLEISYERANDFDCEQDRSNDHSTNEAHSDQLESPSRPENTYDLMPPAIHMVSKLEIGVLSLSTNE